MDKQPHKVIVCVDSDKEACGYLASCLSRELADQISSIAFSSPTEALRYLEKNQADLVTSCIRMPGMDDFEFLKRVKKLHPDLPVLVITESGDIEEYFKAMHTGAYEFINKPILLPELYRVICRAIGLRAPADGHGYVPASYTYGAPKKKVVIFGEDDKHILMAMCIILERMGYDVIPAENGLEVLNLLEVITPDVITLDLDMPLLGGAETLKRIKSDERYKAIPVVILSANTQMEIIKECEDLGCASFLNKPVGMDELSKVLERSLFPHNGRKHMRAGLSIRATVTHKGISHALFTKSLSESGIFIRTKDPLPVGSQVEVVLPLDDGKIILKGFVVYVNRLNSKTVTFHPGMAIEFEDVPPRDSERLKNYVAKLIVQGIEDGGLLGR